MLSTPCWSSSTMSLTRVLTCGARPAGSLTWGGVPAAMFCSLCAKSCDTDTPENPLAPLTFRFLRVAPRPSRTKLMIFKPQLSSNNKYIDLTCITSIKFFRLTQTVWNNFFFKAHKLPQISEVRSACLTVYWHFTKRKQTTKQTFQASQLPYLRKDIPHSLKAWLSNVVWEHVIH